MAAIRMKHTDDEIVAYARSHIRQMDQQKDKRLVLGFFGIGSLATVIFLVKVLVDKSEKFGGLLQDTNFISGVAFGILGIQLIGISVLGFLRMFNMFYGKDIEVYRLLVKLNDERNG